MLLNNLAFNLPVPQLLLVKWKEQNVLSSKAYCEETTKKKKE